MIDGLFDKRAFSGTTDTDKGKNVGEIEKGYHFGKRFTPDAFRIKSSLPMGILIDKNRFKHDNSE